MCFQYLAFMTTSAALFGVISIFYAGLYAARQERRRRKRPLILILRVLLAVCVATNSLAEFGSGFWLYKQRPYAVLTAELVMAVSWYSHAVSLCVFSTSLSFKGRGPLILNSCWYLTLIASVLHFHSTIRWAHNPTLYPPSDMYFTLLSRVTIYTHMGLQIAYGISLLFSVADTGDDQQEKEHDTNRRGTSIQHRDTSDDEDSEGVREKQPLINRSRSQYGAAMLVTRSEGEGDDVNIKIRVGNAYEDSAKPLSLLVFWWVWPLLKRGAMGFLQATPDLPPLPRSLNTSHIRKRFRNILLKKLQSTPNTDVHRNSESEQAGKEWGQNQPEAASREHEDFMKSEVMLRSVTRSTPQPYTVTPEPSTTTNSHSARSEGGTRTGATKSSGQSSGPGTSMTFLFSAMNRAFGCHYYPLGLLKLTTDLLGFAGPLLLYQLVSFIENKKVSLNVCALS